MAFGFTFPMDPSYMRWTTNHVVRIDNEEDRTKYDTYKCVDEWEEHKKFLEQGDKNHPLAEILECSDVFKQPLKGKFFSERFEYIEIILEMCIGYDGCAPEADVKKHFENSHNAQLIWPDTFIDRYDEDDYNK
jgi:hypothetical protein